MGEMVAERPARAAGEADATREHEPATPPERGPGSSGSASPRAPDPGAPSPRPAHPSPERRHALAVGSFARRALLALAVLAVTLAGLFGALAALIAQAAPVAAATGTWPLFVAIGGVSFALVLTAVSLGVYTALTLHRVLGAAFHIRGHLAAALARAEEGDGGAPLAAEPAPLVLRPGDALVELAAEVNRASERLRPIAGGDRGDGHERAR